ncbi:NADPH:quinone oxidoreductase family protein [Rhodoferax sediminis]|uniref:NADPH:quinone oxidoreductase family protein n=1 Tax=Rhodoferax sediminis TaxID=2509614 RepID=A0A515DDU9_9BURK|nr:NADPH:quinone oxidoreductase family protein [Rhodoferax sediminis]QDL38584.1 NADPH:quinone oxidoreductase family protein [Rhodoferax sediminis]
MLAVQVRKPGPIDSHCTEDIPNLTPGAGQVLVDVQAAAVNYPDLLVVTGRYQTVPPLPFTPGKDAAGVVRAVGAGVNRVKPGDRVLLHVEYGTFATQALAREDQCLPLPAGMNFVDAVSLGLAAQTAWFALLERGAFEPGDRVLVTGASGAVGQAAVQIASALGGTVLAAASNLERARSVLAGTQCHFIDLSAPDLRNSLRDQVHAATGGQGVDVVIETLGGDAFDAALRAMAWCGRIVAVGFAAGRIPDIKAGHLLVKNIAALGLQWTDYRDRQPQRVARAHAALSALWERGALRAPVMKTLPLREFAEAFRLIDTRQASGRLVLTMD